MEIKIDFNESDFESSTFIFKGEKMIPFGEIHSLYINKVNNKLEDQATRIIKIAINNQNSAFFITPTYVSMDE